MEILARKYGRFQDVDKVIAWLRSEEAYELSCDVGIPTEVWSQPGYGMNVKEMLTALADAIAGKPLPWEGPEQGAGEP